MFANNLTSFDNRVMSEQLSRAIETSGLTDKDERIRIVGSFFVQRTPNIQHEVSRQLEEACVGLELPVRFPHFLEYDFVSIEHADLIACLLLQGRASEADQFEAHVVRKNWPYERTNWGFDTSSGIAVIDSAVTADSYYKNLPLRHR